MRHGDVRYNFTACRAEGIELAHDRLVRESCTRILLHLVSEGSCVLAADVIWQGWAAWSRWQLYGQAHNSCHHTAASYRHL